jgi:cytochrome P450
MNLHNPPGPDETAAVSRPFRRIDELPGPRGLPFVGNLLQLKPGRVHTILNRWADEFGSLYKLRMRRKHVVVIAEPELIGEVLRKRPEVFQRRKLVRDVMLELGIDGVFTAEGADWRRQRKLAMHALNTNHLREFFGRLEQVTARLQRRWERSARDAVRVDAQRDLMRFTVDVTSGLVFGNDLNTLEQSADPIQQHLEKIFPALGRRVLAPYPYWRHFKLPQDRQLDASLAEVRKLVNALIASSHAELDADPALRAKPANFLQAMIVAQDQETGTFSNEEIVGNALTMLLAGEDTTANTLSWMMHLMAQHPEIQTKMQEEADRVLGEADRPPDYGATDALRYIEAVAHEAMRLKPVAPFLGMEPGEDVELGGLHIPKGTAMYLLTAHPAVQDKNFAEAAQLRPERWVAEEEGRGEAPHNTKAMAPFGAGPRYCPGRHLAMLEIKMVAAMLCKNFDVVRITDGPPVEEWFSVTMMPRNLLVTLRARRSARTAA